MLPHKPQQKRKHFRGALRGSHSVLAGVELVVEAAPGQ